MILTAEFWSPASNVLVFAATLLVLAGLMLEGEWEWIDRLIRDARDNRKTQPLHAERVSLGEKLVALGVAGELLFGVTAFCTTSIVDTRQKREIAKLEAAAAPRRLTEDQRLAIISNLTSLKGATVQVTAQASDTEAVIFGADIYSVLKGSELNASHDFGFSVGEAHTGVLILYTPDDASAKIGNGLLMALRAAHVVSKSDWTSGSHPFVQILVGQKPFDGKVEIIEVAHIQ
jgi:hypothetical protein